MKNYVAQLRLVHNKERRKKHHAKQAEKHAAKLAKRARKGFRTARHIRRLSKQRLVA
jgi:hypothetical protein